ncbi:Ig-like domain-containing protein [Latilactobacillus sakei]|uniref:Ig-like domain-containing protein n=1 Tax=Latilactobacillus sakei TaxID=1599 RepID=A0AAF0K9I8_LATSK|nr:Ig-like domain-containing protein [Latilactobacillus sakei]WGI18560.1 Ig-like domain-containing protein [Latilactobacillus sakei]
MKVGDTKQVTASAVPADASDAAEVVAAVKWSSSDDTVATVSSDGTISAKAEGTATITATSGSFTATVAVSVSAA